MRCIEERVLTIQLDARLQSLASTSAYVGIYSCSFRGLIIIFSLSLAHTLFDSCSESLPRRSILGASLATAHTLLDGCSESLPRGSILTSTSTSSLTRSGGTQDRLMFEFVSVHLVPIYFVDGLRRFRGLHRCPSAFARCNHGGRPLGVADSRAFAKCSASMRWSLGGRL